MGHENGDIVKFGQKQSKRILGFLMQIVLAALPNNVCSSKIIMSAAVVTRFNYLPSKLCLDLIKNAVTEMDIVQLYPDIKDELSIIINRLWNTQLILKSTHDSYLGGVAILSDDHWRRFQRMIPLMPRGFIYGRWSGSKSQDWREFLLEESNSSNLTQDRFEAVDICFSKFDLEVQVF